MNTNNRPDGVQIELTDDVAQGTYANLAVIAHSSSDFVLDFIRMVPGVPKAKVKSRIILTPENAKRLFFALQDNLTKFEEQYGPIQTDPASKGLFPPTGPVKGEA